MIFIILNPLVESFRNILQGVFIPESRITSLEYSLEILYDKIYVNTDFKMFSAAQEIILAY